jgi:hypothetical protein
MAHSTESLTSSASRMIGSGSGWSRRVAKRVRERDVRRQLLYNNARKNLTGALSLSRRLSQLMPEIAAEYAKATLGAMAAFWLIARGLHWAFGVDAVLCYALFGIIYALQSSYYSYRLRRDPNFKIPRCACAKRSRHENSEQVLATTTGFTRWMPVSAPAALFYALLLMPWVGHDPATVPVLAATACVVTLRLGHRMVFRIGSLCSNCISLGALNLLILLETL